MYKLNDQGFSVYFGHLLKWEKNHLERLAADG